MTRFIFLFRKFRPRFPFWGWAIVGIIAFTLIFVEPGQSYDGESQRISSAAGVLVNKEVHTHCDNELVAAGMADIPGRDMWIYGAYCDYLEDDLYEPEVEGAALITVAHEARHLRGYYNEAKVECWALQQTDDLARIMGYSDEQIPELVMWARWDHRKLVWAVPEYGNPQCHQDRAWDLTPRDGVWP